MALRRATGHILAGTEQHNIVAFPLFELIASLEEEKRRRRAEAEMLVVEAEATARLEEEGDAVAPAATCEGGDGFSLGLAAAGVAAVGVPSWAPAATEC